MPCWVGLCGVVLALLVCGVVLCCIVLRGIMLLCFACSGVMCAVSYGMVWSGVE